MAGIKEIRRNNLEALLKRYRNQREFAEAAGLVPAHVSQMKTGAREIGEEVARRIEKQLNLQPAWMDVEDMDSAYLLSDEEREILEKVRHTSPELRIRILDLLDADFRRMHPEIAEKLGPRDVGYQKTAEQKLVDGDNKIRSKRAHSKPTVNNKKGRRDANK